MMRAEKYMVLYGVTPFTKALRNIDIKIWGRTFHHMRQIRMVI